MKDKMKKNKLPRLRTDEEAENFVAEGDLTQYDLSGFRTTTFEFEKKTKSIQLRMSDGLFAMIQAKARKLDIPYTRYIREVLERDLSSPKQ